jgi:hypothetical protein
VVHSAGTRNPFGLAVDSANQLWFTNNYGRADTNGDGTSDPHFHDQLDSDLSDDVGDQFFAAHAGGDYGYDNTSFRGDGAFPTTPVRSTTFDNLDADRPGFGVLHDPADPNGLGPSSSANGFDFVSMKLAPNGIGGSREYAVVTRWSDLIAEQSPGTDVLEYRDVVVIDPASGQTTRILGGFNNPIDVLRDGRGGFFVADYALNGTIYHVSVAGGTRIAQDPVRPVLAPEPSSAAGATLLAGAWLRRRRRDGKR